MINKTNETLRDENLKKKQAGTILENQTNTKSPEKTNHDQTEKTKTETINPVETMKPTEKTDQTEPTPKKRGRKKKGSPSTTSSQTLPTTTTRLSKKDRLIVESATAITSSYSLLWEIVAQQVETPELRISKDENELMTEALILNKDLFEGMDTTIINRFHLISIVAMTSIPRLKMLNDKKKYTSKAKTLFQRIFKRKSIEVNKYQKTVVDSNIVE